jgi:hypothetical protein
VQVAVQLELAHAEAVRPYSGVFHALALRRVDGEAQRGERRRPRFSFATKWANDSIRPGAYIDCFAHLEPQLEPTEFAALYRILILEDGLRNIHREGLRRAMPH